MWILKNSKEPSEHLKYPIFNRITSIKSFGVFFFNPLYNYSSRETLKQTHKYFMELFAFQKR